jgi:hypothetical protein
VIIIRVQGIQGLELKIQSVWSAIEKGAQVPDSQLQERFQTSKKALDLWLSTSSAKPEFSSLKFGDVMQCNSICCPIPVARSALDRNGYDIAFLLNCEKEPLLPVNELSIPRVEADTFSI